MIKPAAIAGGKIAFAWRGEKGVSIALRKIATMMPERPQKGGRFCVPAQFSSGISSSGLSGFGDVGDFERFDGNFFRFLILIAAASMRSLMWVA